MKEVFIITLNAERTLEECLINLQTYTEGAKVTIIDGGSIDATIRIAEQYGCKIIYDLNGSRGSARQKAIELVKTDVFAFIDSDVIVDKGWYDILFSALNNDDVGGVSGIPDTITNSDCYKYHKIQLNHIVHKYKGKPHEIGNLHTGFTLIKKNAVSGIKIPHDLNNKENVYITQYIRNNGYKTIRLYRKFKHLAEGSWYGTFYENAYYSKKYNYWGLKDLFVHCLSAIRYTLICPQFVLKDLFYSITGYFNIGKKMTRL